MVEQRLKQNIAILMAYSGHASINMLAKTTRLNPSFLGRVISFDQTGLGGWNFQNLFLLAGALKVNPASLLFGDFDAAIKTEVEKFTTNQK
jgi:ABC-type uncharacterized transport system permease subunit